MVETSPALHDRIHISKADEEVALSTVKFWWTKRTVMERIRSLFPGGRQALHQSQARRRAEQDHLTAEADAILESAISDRDMSGTWRSTSRRTRKDSKLPQRTPSRSRRVVDALGKGVRRVSRQGSTNDFSGSETPRTRKRRTIPDILQHARERSLSRSRDGSSSRPASRASGRRTPRFMNGSRSNLTSPSTAGFTSEAESELFDSDDALPIQQSPPRKSSDPRDWDKDHRRTTFTRHSITSFSKMLGWRPKSSPQGTLSESGSRGNLNWMGVPRSPAGPSSPVHQSSVTSGDRLARRSADEMSPRPCLSVGARQRLAGKRTGSGPVLGVMHNEEGSGVGRVLELSDDAELIRAASWGDVADEYGKDYGYGGNPIMPYDDDGESDYGVSTHRRMGGSYVYSGGVGFGSGEIDEYSLNDDTRLVGAGGVLSHPASGPSSPCSLSGLSIGPGMSGPGDRLSLQGIAQEVGVAGSSSSSAIFAPGTSPTNGLMAIQTQDLGRRRGASIGSRQNPYPHVISSPLAQTPLNVDQDNADVFELSILDDEGHDDHQGHPSDLDVTRVGRRGHQDDDASSMSGVRVIGHGHRSLMVDEEVPDSLGDVFDDDDDNGGGEEESSSGDEPPPIEVRRRRPSEIARSQSRTRREREPYETEPIIDVEVDPGSDVDYY